MNTGTNYYTTQTYNSHEIHKTKHCQIAKGCPNYISYVVEVSSCSSWRIIIKKKIYLKKRYSIWNLVSWGITFDSEKWYKTFLLQNYPHGSRHCQLSYKYSSWQSSLLVVRQIIIFVLWKICMTTDSGGCRPYMLFLWQPTVTAAIWIIF